MNIEKKQMYGTEVTVITYKGEEVPMIGILLNGNTMQLNDDVKFVFDGKAEDKLNTPRISVNQLPDGREKSGMLATAVKREKDGKICCHYQVAIKKDKNNSGINIKQMANIVIGLGASEFQLASGLIDVQDLKIAKVEEKEILKISPEAVSSETLGEDPVIVAGTIKASEIEEPKPRKARKKKK